MDGTQPVDPATDEPMEALPPPGLHATVVDTQDGSVESVGIETDGDWVEQPATVHADPDPEPPKQLSDETKRILSMIPSGVNDRPREPVQNFSIDRFDPELQGILNAPVTVETDEVETVESSGVSIEIRRPHLNADYELEKAYTALISGQSDVAIEIYKRVLLQHAGNQAALFGLATTYHRLGDLALARPFYGKLLSINPDHRDALNNFLVLVSDESPEEALRYMEELEDKNPDFSPILAQMAVLYQKLGNPEAAISKMARAVSLAPENLAYKYNLAVLLDQQGRYADAVDMYRQLLISEQRGETLPTDAEALRKRVNYLELEGKAARTGAQIVM